MRNFSDEFLKITKEFWQARLNKEISIDDAEMISMNCVLLLKHLMALDEKYSIKEGKQNE